jgi:hypothetical protein
MYAGQIPGDVIPAAAPGTPNREARAIRVATDGTRDPPPGVAAILVPERRPAGARPSPG